MATVTIKRQVQVKYLRARCCVRYWEDTKVNGVNDINGLLIPCRPEPRRKTDHMGSNTWCPVIDLDTGRIENWPHGTTAHINYKVCDEGTYTLLDADRNVVVSINGYVPTILSPGDTPDGDYVCMMVGPDGSIANWRVDLAAFEQ